MRARRSVAIVTVVAVLVGAGAAAFVRVQVDPETFERYLAETVHDATGREVQIRGTSYLELFPSPTLVVENVALANAAWSISPDMARVRRLEARIALLPLLVGELRVKRIALVKPHLMLERNAEGRPNWAFARAADHPGRNTSGGSLRIPSGLGLVVSTVEIAEAEIIFRRAKPKRQTRVRIPALLAHGEVAGEPLSLDAGVIVDERLYRVAAEVGELTALLRNEPYDVALTARTKGARITAHGVIERPLQWAGIWFDVAVDGDSLKGLAALVGQRMPLEGHVHAKAMLTDVEGGFRLDKIAADVELPDGKAVLTGSVDDLLRLRGLDLGLQIDTKTLAFIEKLTGKPFLINAPLRATAKMTKDAKGRLRLDGIAARLRLAGSDLRVTGAIAQLPRMRGVDLGLTLKTRSLSRLSRYARVELPRVGPVKATARVSRTRYGFKLADIEATAGRSDAAGTLWVATGGRRPEVAGSLTSRRMDLDQLLGTGKQSTKDDGRFVPDVAVPVKALRVFEADLELAAERLHFARLDMRDVDLGFALERSKLKLTPKGKIANGTFELELDVDARHRKARTFTRFEAKGVDIGTVSRQIRKVKLADGVPADMRIIVRGRGNRLREIMANLEGGVRIVAGEGTIHDDMLDRAGDDFVIAMLSSTVETDKKEKETTRMRCGVVRLTVNDGLARAEDTIALETDRTLMSAKGIIDLSDETLDLAVDLRSRERMKLTAGSFSGFVRLGGTMAQPKLRTNGAAVAGAAASVAGAVVTSGISLIAQGILNQITRDDTPCRTALKRKVANPERGADGAKSAGSRTQEETGRVYETGRHAEHRRDERAETPAFERHVPSRDGN